MDLVKILKRIEDLYNEKDISENDIKMLIEKYPSRVEEWNKYLGNYGDEEIIQAIDEYWRFKNDKVRPKLAQLDAMIETKNRDFEINRDFSEQEKYYRLAEITKEQNKKTVLEKFGG